MTEMEVLQVPAELAAMVELYKERRPKRVLEIGCWDGGTLREWLQNAAHGAVIAAVDLEHRNQRAYQPWLKSGCELHTLTASSHSEQAVEFMTKFAPYDWAFVDGDHGDFGVRTDVSNVLPLMAPGGLMLLHDITPPEHLPSYPPLDVFNEFRATHETWAYQYDEPRPWSSGIGVVRL